MQSGGAGDMEHEARLYAEEQLQASKAEVSGLQDTVGPGLATFFFF